MQRTEYIDLVKQVSIRGRVALGITCLEGACCALNINDERIKRIIVHFWKFVSSHNLGLWEEEAEPLVSWVTENISTISTLDHEAQYDGVLVLVLRLIDAIYSIAVNNLYVAVKGFSEETYNCTCYVLYVMHQAGLPWPPISRYLKSPFSDFHGWGYAEAREFFMTDL